MSIYTNYHPLVIRDNYQFVRGNLKGYQTQGGETGTSETVGATNNPGAVADVPSVICISHNFGQATQPGNIRSLDIECLFNYAGTTDITANQSVSAIRGAASIASVTTLGTGSSNEYLYGVQGKFILQGTANLAAGFGAGLFGQFDSSGASATATAGYLAALHLDMGSTSSITTTTVINAASILNTTQCLINSVFKVIANANYFMDLSESNLTGHWVVGTTASTAAGTLKVKVNGNTRYIQLYSSVA